jgi:glycosyltransferase involved in cell wall biosynthesis
MINILFITIYTGIGGGESIQLNLMRAIDRERYRIHLLTPEPGAFTRAAEELGVSVHYVPFRGTIRFFIPSLWKRFPIVHTLKTFLQEHHIDVVMSDYHSLPYCVPAAQSQGIPVLWNVMGWWFPLFWWQRNFFRTQVDTIIAITDSVKEKWLGQPPALPPENIQVIIPGIDTDYFTPNIDRAAVRKQLGVGPNTPVVAMAARFQVNKGHEYFLEAARIIAQAFPETRFLVAGDNVFKVAKDEAYKRSILAMKENDPLLRDRVTYLGFYPDVREIMAAADVMVCSSYFESLLMVALESMAMERPIVSTEVGGPSETIVDGETGFLVPPYDGKAIAEKVIVLLKDPELRRKMGIAGREYVLEHLSIERYTEKLCAIFDDMIATHAHYSV